jgi:hypothetical protein
VRRAFSWRSVGTLYEERKAVLAKMEQLRRKLDVHLLDHLLQFVQLIRPDATKTGGLSELEYTLAMLLELNICTWKQVRPFILQFRQLDADGSGWLSVDDMEDAIQRKRDRAGHITRRSNSHSHRGSSGHSTRRIMVADP